MGLDQLMVLNGMTTVGVIAAFINYFVNSQDRLSQICDFNWIQFKRQLLVWERVFELWWGYQKIQKLIKKDAFVVQNLTRAMLHLEFSVWL